MTTHTPSPSSSDSERRFEVAQLERDQAQASAKRWRRLYEVEAQQRQKDTEIADQTIQSLRAEIQHLCQFSTHSGGPAPALASGQSSVAPNAAHHLQNQLTDLIAERDQLLQALEQEQHAHAQTRDNLINALGDALGAPKQKQSLALPSSRAGARAGAIILKDRNARKPKFDESS